MSSSKYVVPASDRREFDRIVQKANRRIMANLKYIQQEDVYTEDAIRSLVGDYADRSTWHTDKVVFSRSIKFNSKKEYEQYKRHVMEYSAEDRKPAERKKGYIKAIIKSLTTSAIDNNIPLENGRLPGEIRKKLNELTLDQLVHYFKHDDPVSDMEYLAYSDIDFNGVDAKGFVENVDAIITSLKSVYPNANERRYREMLANGLDSMTALKTLFPKATPAQLRYYTSKNGKIPDIYTPPRQTSSKKKKKSRKRRRKKK